MEQKKVLLRVADYYGHSEFYPYMPELLFDFLEDAYFHGGEILEVDSSLYEEMMAGMAAATQ